MTLKNSNTTIVTDADEASRKNFFGVALLYW